MSRGAVPAGTDLLEEVVEEEPRLQVADLLRRGARAVQESIGIGLQRFTSQSATRPQLKQMKRGARASCLTAWSCPWLTRTQRCP